MSTVSIHRPARRAKGELARERLKSAAIAVLDRVGYFQLRIKDVTAEAGVAAGLFHHYYSDLRSLVEEILEEHIARSGATELIEREVSKGDWFNRLRSHYRFVIRNHAEHPGIMRCIQQFCVDDADFRDRWKASFYSRLEQLVEVFPYVFPDSELNAGEARLVVYGLSGIGQDLLREYYVERDTPLLDLGLSDDELAEWLAVLLYRGLFACNPPKEQLHYASRILTIKRHAPDLEHSD